MTNRFYIAANDIVTASEKNIVLAQKLFDEFLKNGKNLQNQADSVPKMHNRRESINSIYSYLESKKINVSLAQKVSLSNVIRSESEANTKKSDKAPQLVACLISEFKISRSDAEKLAANFVAGNLGTQKLDELLDKIIDSRDAIYTAAFGESATDVEDGAKSVKLAKLDKKRLLSVLEKLIYLARDYDEIENSLSKL